MAAYRDPLAPASVKRFRRQYEEDPIALRAGLLTLTIGKPVSFRFRGTSQLVMPYDEQHIGHRAVSLIPDAVPEENLALPGLGPTDEAEAPLQITVEQQDTLFDPDDHVFRLTLSTPFPAHVFIRARDSHLARMILRERFDILRHDVLASEREAGTFRHDGNPLVLDDVHVNLVDVAEDMDPHDLPVLYR